MSIEVPATYRVLDDISWPLKLLLELARWINLEVEMLEFDTGGEWGGSWCLLLPAACCDAASRPFGCDEDWDDKKLLYLDLFFRVFDGNLGELSSNSKTSSTSDSAPATSESPSDTPLGANKPY